MPGVDDSYTKSLLHFDGANGSTTFTDESGKIWTAGGNAKISTAQSQFGGASGLFDGNGDYIETSLSADFAFGTGDFTVDFWIYLNSLKNFSEIYESRYNSHITATGFVLLNNSSGKFGLVTDNAFKITTNTGISTGGWHHIALVRNGNVHTIYIDGTADVNTWTGTPNYSNQAALIGAEWTKTAGFVDGYIDELRVSKGIARWTSNFTPPTSAYEPPASIIENISAVSILTELTAPSAVRASGATLLTELTAPSAVRVSGALLLVEYVDVLPVTGTTPLTLNTRSTAAHLNNRATTLTLEARS